MLVHKQPKGDEKLLGEGGEKSSDVWMTYSWR